MYKTVSNGTTNFHAQRKVYTAPVVVEQYTEETNGDIIYILETGNTISKDRYDSIWNPVKKPINWKSKGANPDTTKIPH